jgi:hypothetical protein
MITQRKLAGLALREFRHNHPKRRVKRTRNPGIGQTVELWDAERRVTATAYTQYAAAAQALYLWENPDAEIAPYHQWRFENTRKGITISKP